MATITYCDKCDTELTEGNVYQRGNWKSEFPNARQEEDHEFCKEHAKEYDKLIKNWLKDKKGINN